MDRSCILNHLHVGSSEPFQYVAWNLSSFDLDEEVEDAEALQAFEEAEEESSDDYAKEENDDVSIQPSPFTSTIASTCFLLKCVTSMILAY